jgi:(2Fe-2S) ferredoxin
MNVYPGPVFYNLLTPEAIEEIVQEHLLGGRPVARWLFRPKPLRPIRR